MGHDNDYRDDHRSGIEQAVCAWAILIALALLFGVIDLVWPGQPASLSLVTGDFTQAAKLKRAFDKEDADEIDLWDGGANENEFAFERRCGSGRIVCPAEQGAALLWTVKSDPIRVTLNGSDLDEEHRCFIANTSHTPIGIVAAMGFRSLTVVAAVFAHAF